MAATWLILRQLHLHFGLKFHSGSKVYRVCHACRTRCFHTLRNYDYSGARTWTNANAKPFFLKPQNGLLTQFDSSVTSVPHAAFCTTPRGGEATNEILSPEEKRILKKKRKEERRQERIERQKLKQQKSRSQEDIVYTSNTQPGGKKDTQCPLPATYSAKYVEAAWYEWWEKNGFFRPDSQASGSPRERFVICLPPPNVTGTLHLGHALGNSIQDAIVRWHRMHGRSVLWNPGCDHAGIATQVVVEKELWRTRGKTRHDIGRTEFTDLVWKWKEEKGGRICDQMRRLGSSLDWSRECFTLDPKLSRAVTKAFMMLHEEGIIYRDNRLVNWSCALRSAISDIEVTDLELDGKTSLAVPGYEEKVNFGTLTSFAYPVEGLDTELVVATTRPETMLGDTAVAVHPHDERYTHLHGRHVLHPLTGRRMPVVCDEFVKSDFGTGAVKVTPAHDPNDYELGRRHGLDFVNILDDTGCMVNVPEAFQGQKRFHARMTVLDALDQLGLLRGEQEHAMVLPVCSRSSDIIEPILKDQWFVSCEEMAQQAIEAVKSGQLELIPANYEKHWADWLSETRTRDWCISRQLWWGHQIPAYQVFDSQGKVLDSDGRPLWVCAASEVDALHKAGLVTGRPTEQLRVTQDEDVLDTWFSSALLPFSIFGWPEQTTDLARFYPTDLLETASDIIFFWVARMVMLGQKLTGQLPFKQVLFHSILRDAHGRKMSKSLGNIIDPMDVIQGISLEQLQEQLEHSNLDPAEVRRAQEGQSRDFPLGIAECGADALRFALCCLNFKSHFVNIDIHRMQHSRNFCNKVWQAFKFTTTQLGPDYQPAPHDELACGNTPTDLWILSRLSALVEQCESGFSTYDLNRVAEHLQDFWWADFCDVYLEYSKPILQSDDATRITAVKNILYTCVDTGLRALSPFMPFLTEELYQRLPQRKEESKVDSVCIAAYPQPQEYPWQNPKVEADMAMVKEIYGTALLLRRDFNLTKERAHVFVQGATYETSRIVADYHTVLKTMSRSSSVTWLDSGVAPTGGCVTVDVNLPESSVETNCRLHMQLLGLVDIAAQLARLETQELKLNRQLLKVESQLQKDGPGTDKMEGVKKALQRTEKAIATLRQLS